MLSCWVNALPMHGPSSLLPLRKPKVKSQVLEVERDPEGKETVRVKGIFMGH